MLESEWVLGLKIAECEVLWVQPHCCGVGLEEEWGLWGLDLSPDVSEAMGALLLEGRLYTQSESI
jgi:hypothetical protein